jgi:osmoprotectant transport system substrate-binding protein
VLRLALTRLLPALVAPCCALLLLACGSHAGKRRSLTRATTATAITAPATTAVTATLPGSGRPPVVIGDKNFAEQFVLGELYRQALAAQGFTVTLNRNIGATEVTMQALLSGRLDLYPEYLDTWNRDVAGDRRPFASERAALAAARRHAQARGLQLLDPTPYSNVGAIVVTPAYAQANGLRSIPDLGAVPEAWTLGGPLQFQQQDPGLAAIEKVYGVRPRVYKPLDVGAQLGALYSGMVQAAVVTTTDGQLQAGQYAMLDDPRHVFGWGNVVPVVPSSVLAAEGPTFSRTINAVDALLTMPVIRQLNADVEVASQDPAVVAKRFLEANGLIPVTSG